MNHREIIELLPWYANETLNEDERTTVENHLKECGECAQEVKNLTSMRKAVVETGNQGPALPPFALNRALAQIEDYERAKGPAISSRQDQPPVAWGRYWRLKPIFVRALIAVQLVLLLAFGTVAVYQHNHPNVIYTTSGGPENDKASTTIAVGFVPTASEQEIRQAILGIKGKIVDGPSALGLYTVQVPISREHTTEIEQVLETLRQNQRVIRFAAQK